MLKCVLSFTSLLLAPALLSAATYIGNYNTNQHDSNSVNNTYGRHGSKYSTDSIHNPYGQYGEALIAASLRLIPMQQRLKAL